MISMIDDSGCQNDSMLKNPQIIQGSSFDQSQEQDIELYRNFLEEDSQDTYHLNEESLLTKHQRNLRIHTMIDDNFQIHPDFTNSELIDKLKRQTSQQSTDQDDSVCSQKKIRS